MDILSLLLDGVLLIPVITGRASVPVILPSVQCSPVNIMFKGSTSSNSSLYH